MKNTLYKQGVPVSTKQGTYHGGQGGTRTLNP